MIYSSVKFYSFYIKIASTAVTICSTQNVYNQHTQPNQGYKSNYTQTVRC